MLENRRRTNEHVSGPAVAGERREDDQRGGSGDSRVPPLSILHVAAPGPVGGLETVLEGLSRGLVERGHRVRVLAVVDPVSDGHPFVESLSRSAVDVIPVAVSPRNYPAEAIRVARHCRDFSPDVVHSHGFRADVVDALTARLLGYPIVTTVHGASQMGGIADLYEWLQERAFRLFDGVIAVSDALAAELRREGVDGERIAVIHNAFPGRTEFHPRGEARARLGLGEDEFVIGWVGRMIEAKGPDLFIQCLAEVDEIDFTACMIGDGPELARVKELTRKLKMSDRVRFHGRIEDAAKLFRAFDVFVLSSRREGTPMVLLEAMAAGVPVVTPRVGGVSEVVGPEEARLVPPRDPKSLAAAVADVESRSDEARRRAGRARVSIDEEYSRSAWIRKHELFYLRSSRTARSGHHA